MLILAGLACLMGGFVPSLEASTMQDFFLARKWAEIDALLMQVSPDVTSLPPRELSLGVNALWLQKRYAEALELIEAGKKTFPEEIRPYCSMFQILGYERTGERAKALEEARAFWKTPPPEFLRYYVAYALGRLERVSGNNAEAAKWYRIMADLGETKSYRHPALAALLALPGAKAEDALRMLDDFPLNREALKILEEVEKPSARILTALGYAAYAEGSYHKALKLFDRALEAGARGRAEYWRAFSLYQLKRYEEALDQWRVIALRGASYGASSTRRIGICAYRGVKTPAVEALEELAEKKDGALRETALYYLMVIAHELGPSRNFPKWRDELRKSFPSGKFGMQSYWNGAWDAWKEGNLERAANELSRGLPHATGTSWPPRFLYWIARTQDILKRPDKAERFRKQLGSLYPLSYYSFLVFPEGSKPIKKELPRVLQSSPSLLEEWGFIQYARLSLAKSSKASDRFRAARIALWDGDVRGAYLLANTFSGVVRTLEYLPREVLEMLYPRAYEKDVLRESERFGISPNYVWAVMRQESGYDAEATSYVGAMGLMQLMPATGRDVARRLEVENPRFYDPATNILLGTSYLASRMRLFKSFPKAAAAYNAGAGAVRKWEDRGKDQEEWIEEIPYLETNDYVHRVMGNYAVYRMLYGEEASPKEEEVEPLSADALPEDEEDRGP
ncbi:MAG TPA: transglycosylase SLT domain-containing protein [Synergistaceae bacterium]|nr:transglycosylase SLT domain-containing protein [Synergistaceae bacterium]